MFRYVTHSLAALALLWPVTAPAMEEVSQIIRVEVLDGGPTRDGGHHSALRFTLAPGWKTYWRSPGDAGIPPLFDFARSSNVEAVSMVWPTPKLFDQNGMTSIGYADTLVLPIMITPRDPGAPIRLSGSVELGICEDVCIPGHLKFDAALDPEASRSPAIAAALAQRPYSAQEAQVVGVACRLEPAAGGLRLLAEITMPSAGGTETVVFEPNDPDIWAAQAATRRDGGVLHAQTTLSHPAGGFALDRSALRMTVLGRDHAVDIHGCDAG